MGEYLELLTDRWQVQAGFAVVDVMRSLDSPVHPTCIGHCESMAAGVGTDFKWFISVESTRSRLFLDSLFSYDPPQVMSINGPGSVDADTKGGQLLQIEGINFGPASTSTSLTVIYSLFSGDVSLRDFVAESCEVKTDSLIN